MALQRLCVPRLLGNMPVCYGQPLLWGGRSSDIFPTGQEIPQRCGVLQGSSPSSDPDMAALQEPGPTGELGEDTAPFNPPSVLVWSSPMGPPPQFPSYVTACSPPSKKHFGGEGKEILGDGTGQAASGTRPLPGPGLGTSIPRD